MLKDKFGNKLTVKEYMQRWKQGVMGITPIQQIKIQIRSTWITITGLGAGIVICIIGIKTLWWLLLILAGGLGNTGVQMISLQQKNKFLKQFDSEKEEVLKGSVIENGNVGSIL